jgi:hypothetical protein
LAALLFLYRNVLEMDLPRVDLVRAIRPKRLPVVLSVDEVRAVLCRMDDPWKLMAELMYGAGLRLLETCRLRVKDLDFDRRQILVREGKGERDRDRNAGRMNHRGTEGTEKREQRRPEGAGCKDGRRRTQRREQYRRSRLRMGRYRFCFRLKDRPVPLPYSPEACLRDLVAAVARLHARDVEEGHGRVFLPHALAVKYPAADCELAWQHLLAPTRTGLCIAGRR